jgi:Methyltransferase domain
MSNTHDEKCRVCGSDSGYVFSQPVLGRPTAYFDCQVCGYVQTQTPYWLDEAYSSAINSVDTGIMNRNLLNVRRVVMTLLALRRMRGRVIDHAGGYGILVRMLRDVGVDARWRDKYCENLLARGFETPDNHHELLTAFEVFEHLVNPLEELSAMLADSPSVLMSTDLVPTRSTPPADWWYYGPEHGQHVGFFRAATLGWMAQKLGCHHSTDGVSLHLFSRDPIPRGWPLLAKLWRLSPLVTRFMLSSKTTSDFNLLRKDHLGSTRAASPAK